MGIRMIMSRCSRRVARHLGVVAVAFATALPLAAAAQEACKPLALKSPALKLDEAYRMAEAREGVEARRRAGAHHQHDPGAAQARRFVGVLEHPVLLAVGERPRGDQHLPRAAHVLGAAVRGPDADLKPGFVLDGAKLHEIAKKHGEKPMAEDIS
jgi:hypothetical protein